MTYQTQRGTRGVPKHAATSLLVPNRTRFSAGLLAAVATIALWAAIAIDPAGAATGHAAKKPVNAVAQQRVLAAAAAGVPTGTIVASVAPAQRPTHSATSPANEIAPASGLAASGIPTTALTAYQNGADREGANAPGCGLRWPLLAAIGRVESDHGRFAGAILHSDGLSTPPVIGIPLDGHGTALIRDTDGGALDGDAVYDRAVGPMQFIPSTWAGWGVDMNGDGRADAFNIFDAAGAAGDYLCAAGGDLTTSAGQVQAILSYNYSYDYVATVMSLERIYASGVGISVPVLPTALPRHGRPSTPPALPPVDPGAPVAVTAAAVVGASTSSSAPSSGTSSLGSSSSVPSSITTTSSGVIDPTSSAASTPTDANSSSSDTTSPSDPISSSDTTTPTDSPSPTDSTSSADSTLPSGSPSPADVSTATTQDSTSATAASATGGA